MSDRDRYLARPSAALAVVGFLVAAAVAIGGVAPGAQDGMPPADVRAVIEGTWELTEWHVGDVIVRPPEMEGRWMVYDGVVMAIRHRTAPDDYHSTAGYGEYRWGPNTWTYGYERQEDWRGPTAETAELAVSGSIPIRMREHRITREGDLLILESDALRWEYDIPGRTFLLLGANRQPIRRYRKID